jgi:uncharacterized membrane-anchored protein YitT (DUF2179 family)
MSVVREIDEAAFVVVHPVAEVSGGVVKRHTLN